MFGSQAQRQRINELETRLSALQQDYNNLYNSRHNMARLSDITRNGRVLIFTFVRQGERFTIETICMLSDNVDEWKKQAGLIA